MRVRGHGSAVHGHRGVGLDGVPGKGINCAVNFSRRHNFRLACLIK
jgi:hypothetical protein